MRLGAFASKLLESLRRMKMVYIDTIKLLKKVKLNTKRGMFTWNSC